MDEEDLQGGAALTVEGQASRDALAHGQVQIGIRQDDGGVLGTQAQAGSQPVGSRVLGLQEVGRPGGADEGQATDPARLHHRSHHARSRAVDGVDHSRREGVAEGLQEGPEDQGPGPGRFEDHRVSHEQGRDQRGTGLVEGIVQRPHAQGDAQGCPPDLGQDALMRGEA